MSREVNNYISVYLSNKEIKPKLKTLTAMKIIASPSQLAGKLLEDWLRDYEHENGVIKTLEELLGEK